MLQETSTPQTERLSFEEFTKEVIEDYALAVASREASLIGRREVLTGKAKFGIFGDGKELAQIAAAKFMKPGDIRSGYYRDQTLMFATGMSDLEKFFSQLYADTDPEREPASAGRMMNGHYGTRWLDESGEWKNLTEAPQSSSDISPTAGQMVRALGLAYASKMYRQVEGLQEGFEGFSRQGNEVVFCTIGDASTSEGLFWETINAAGVLQVPLAVFVWDDGYGISVPRHYQTTKNSISEILQGFQWEEGLGGLHLYKVKGWDYPSLVETFQKGIEHTRKTHIPAIFHIQELTQPQGHSTSGSHERYKSPERLAWEKEWDCLAKMKEFILRSEIATEEQLEEVEEEARQKARVAKQNAWSAFQAPIRELADQSIRLAQQLAFEGAGETEQIQGWIGELKSNPTPIRKDVSRLLFRLKRMAKGDSQTAREVQRLYTQVEEENRQRFNSHL